MEKVRSKLLFPWSSFIPVSGPIAIFLVSLFNCDLFFPQTFAESCLKAHLKFQRSLKASSEHYFYYLEAMRAGKAGSTAGLVVPIVSLVPMNSQIAAE